MYLQNVLQIEECCYKLRNKVKLFTDNLGSIYDLVRRMSSNVMWSGNTNIGNKKEEKFKEMMMIQVTQN